MFLDIGVGILSAIGVSGLFQVEISFTIIIFSILFALLPDLDWLLYYPQRKDPKYDHEHRNLIHYPLIFLPVGGIILWLVGGTFWGVLFLIPALAHFVHDSIGAGWGVRWLFPFSKNNYSFFYIHPEDKNRKRNLVFTFNDKNLPGLVERYGDPNWFKNDYLNWRLIFGSEFKFFILAVITFLIYLYVR